MSGKPSSDGPRAVRLLLKAIRSLPPREQQTVLAYLLERSLESAADKPGEVFGSSSAAAGEFLEQVGGAAGRMLLSGQGIAAVAALYGLPEGAVRAALQEVSSDPEAQQPLASILGKLAEGRSRSEVAGDLGLAADEVTGALEGLASSPLEARLGRALFAYARARSRASRAFEPTAPRLSPGAHAFAASGFAPGFIGERPQPGAEDPEGLASRVGRLLLRGSDVRQVAELYSVPEAAVGAALHEVADHPDTTAPLSSILRLLADGRSRADAAAELGISEEEATTALEALLPSAIQRRVTHALGSWVGLRSPGAPPAPAFTLAPGVAPLPPHARGGQQMVPVRFPEPQYRRLKDWCGRHGFSMAVVVRGLVERFLDDQERRAA